MAECKKQVIRSEERKIISSYPVNRREIGSAVLGRQLEEVVYHQTFEITPGEDGYVLTLSQDEADVLVDILNNIGGHPKTTRRGLSEDIRRALSLSGVVGKGSADTVRKYPGSIYFSETNAKENRE